MKTIHEALDELLEQKQKTLKEYSFYGTKGVINRIKKIIADLKLSDFTTEELQDYVNDWSKKLSIATIKRYTFLIKSALDINGFKIGKIDFLDDKPKRIRFYSNEEISKIEEYISQHDIKYTALPMIIAMYSGLRIGEILALQWLDIDLDRRFIEVSKNVQDISENGHIKHIIQTPKTKSSYRTVVMPIQLCDILRKFIPANPSEWELYVCNNKSVPTSKRTAERSAELFLEKKIGIKYKGLHSFRHSFATKMMESDIPVKAISDMLGHSTINTTMNIYSHTTNDFKKNCIDKVYESNKQEQKNIASQLLELQKQQTELIVSQLTAMQNTMNELINKLISL